MQPFRAAVLAGVVATTFGAAASAEIYLSNSNNLNEEVNDQIVTMLGQELSVIRRIPKDRLNQLASPAPKSARRGWLFGKRKSNVDGVFKYSSASLSHLPKARGGTQHKCLSEALYFEARGESVKGQFAVAEVILNRVDSRSFPGSVCSVVGQGVGRGRNQCQFSYNCDGRSEIVTEKAAFERVKKVAKIMLDGEPRILTKGATYYHTTAVSPSWSRKFTRTAKIGVHLFYRDARQFTSN